MANSPKIRPAARFFDTFADWFGRSPAARSGKASGKLSRRGLRFESLDERVVLSASPGAEITGTVTSSAGGAAISGVTINLYQNAVGGAPLQTATTNASGVYNFNVQTAGTYVVQQVLPTNSGFSPPAGNPTDSVTVTSADLNGTVTGPSIDSFATNQQVVANVGTPVDSSDVAATEAIGGFRALFVQLTSAGGQVTLTSNQLNPNTLELDSTATATGSEYITWDGNNPNWNGTNVNPSTALNPIGLHSVSAPNGLDLTKGGLGSGILFDMGADHPNATLTFRIYSSAGNYSTATVTIPNTGGGTTQQVFEPFSAFTIGGGTGADFTKVGAIQLQVTGSVVGLNGLISTIGVDGPTQEPAANFTDVPSADLSVTKVDNRGGSSIAATTGTMIPGNQITYTVVYTNNGPNGVTGAALVDTFPAAITADTWIAAETGGATGFTASGAGNIDDTAVAMPSGSTVTYTVTATVNPTATGTLSNTATITAPVNVIDPTPANNSATDTDTLTPSADLSITKVDNKGGSSITGAQGSVGAGSALVYTIVVSNVGPSAVVGGTVNDPIPAGITSDTWTATATGNATGFSASGTGSINDTVNMPVGSTITYTVTANVSASATGSLSNTATVGLPNGETDPTPSNNTATDRDAITSSADLKITKVDNRGGSSITATTGAINAGQSLTYTIVVTNAGPNAANGATVTDTLPSSLTGATYTAVATGGATGFTSTGSGSIHDTAVDLPIGSTITYTVTATLAGGASGTLTNTATVADPSGVTDPTPANNTATDTDTITPVADLQITKVDNRGGSSITPSTGAITAGQALTYTIVVTNVGPGAANGASVADTLPTTLTGATYTAVETGGATGYTSTGAGNINDTAVNMPAGSTITYTVTATLATSATGTLTNTATVTAPNGVTDPTPSNNTATDVDTITPTADLSITKVDNKGGSSITSTTGAVLGGSTLTYTIVVTNNGPAAVTGATVADTLPAAYVASDTYTATATGGATGFTASGNGNINNTGITLPVGSTITYTVIATINTSATGTITNTATVTPPANVSDPTPGNNTATDTDTVTAAASVSGTVFIDLNRNGIQDPTESGIAGATVELLAAGNTTPVATTTTNLSGVYTFSNVTPGTYQTKVVLSNTPTYTTENVASNGSVNSNVDPASGETAAFAVASGQNVVTTNDLTNAGIVPKLSKAFFLGR